MFASRLLRVSVLGLLVVPALSVAAQSVAPATSNSDHIAVSRFLSAVDAYVMQHRVVFEPLSLEMSGPVPPEILCLPEDATAALNPLAEGPEAWPASLEGEIFSPDIADLFRHRIAETFRGYEYNHTDLLAEMDKEALVGPSIRVNEPLSWEIGKLMLPWFIDVLPPLPEELAYRLVGRYLVLIDVELNVVVDMIRAALPMY